MKTYAQLQEKWTKLAVETKSWDYADQTFGPNVVGIHFSEGTFGCGPVFHNRTLFFNNIKEAIAFYRFAHIFFLLDAETKVDTFPALKELE